MLLTQTRIPASCLLFDMDGTLVNSHAPVLRAYTAWANRYGLDVDFVLRESHGRRSIDTIRALAPAGVDVEADNAEIMRREREDTEGVVEIAGARALLESIPEDRWAVVTSADRLLATTRLTAAGLPIPKRLITAENVTRGKPAPDGFLLGARELGADPARAIVFEDSPAGIQAGLAAGATVIAIASALSPEQLGEQAWVPDMRTLRASVEPSGLVLHIA
ncbi:HAD family hydrolase [Pararobbsia silviterrae]|uniref:HAD family hydrolase n=1 Tax=Pararobbsia silviterrae TaxID=1792498 RepID=A0A494XIH2_9BURK|nr:HAD family hydrolase [Pararobbsia silviterrae]RKP50358.1 HAD family hydrolase [Pararobbsia silviterrae]